MSETIAETYGAAVTAKGLQLIAKIIATKASLTLVKVMMGSGTPPEGVYIGDMEDLVEPVAAGTVSEPVYKGSTVEMTVEYRSDMNGGLQEGFVIREFGIFARDPDAGDGGEVMLLYGNLSKYPQYIAPYTGGGLDIRRYPVSITVAEGTTVILDGLPSVVMTLDDIKDYCVSTLLPQLLESSRSQIDTHSRDKYAHQDIRDKIDELGTDLTEDIEAVKRELSGKLESAKGELSGEVDAAKKELSDKLEEAKEELAAQAAASSHTVFEPEDWEGEKLRISKKAHGLDPSASACICTVRSRAGRTAKDILLEEDAKAAGNAIIAAMKEALNANSAAKENPKPYPPADDGHIPFTWEQVQYIILEGTLASSGAAAQAATKKGFNWKNRDTLQVPETTTLEQLLTAAYLPALSGSDANFKKLCTPGTFQGLRLRKKDTSKAVEKYDLDGELVTGTWAAMETNVHMDTATGELVLQASGPYAGDVLVLT